MKIIMSRSFFRGFARTNDIVGTKEWPDINNSMMKDYSAIRKDWENVGNSIERECRKFTETRA
jgi:hypothetical protein